MVWRVFDRDEWTTVLSDGSYAFFRRHTTSLVLSDLAVLFSFSLLFLVSQIIAGQMEKRPLLLLLCFSASLFGTTSAL